MSKEQVTKEPDAVGVAWGKVLMFIAEHNDGGKEAQDAHDAIDYLRDLMAPPAAPDAGVIEQVQELP